MTRYRPGTRWRMAGIAFALLALITVFAFAVGDARGAETKRKYPPYPDVWGRELPFPDDGRYDDRAFAAGRATFFMTPYPRDVKRRFDQIDRTLKREGMAPDAPRGKKPDAAPSPGREGKGDKPEGGDAAGADPRFMENEEGKEHKPKRLPATEETAKTKPELLPVWPDDQKSVPQKRSLTPAAKDMMARLIRGGETISEIIAKDPARVTQGELDKVIGADLYRLPRDPRYLPARRMVEGWFDRVYAGLTSRSQEPIAQRRIAKRVTPSMTPEGQPVSDVAIGIGKDLIDNAGEGDIKPEVIRLQSALNNVTPWHATLETDGVLGPKTHAALRSVLAKDGIGPLQRAFFGR